MVISNLNLAHRMNTVESSGPASRATRYVRFLFNGNRPYILGSLIVHGAVILSLFLLREPDRIQPDISFTEGRSAVSVQFVFLSPILTDSPETARPTAPTTQAAASSPMEKLPEQDTAVNESKTESNSPNATSPPLPTKIPGHNPAPERESKPPAAPPALAAQKQATQETAGRSKDHSVQRPENQLSQNQNSDPRPVGVDTPATVRSKIIPVYPMRSRRKGEEGRVIVEAVINAAGKVVDCRIVKSSGFSRLDNAAVSATMRSMFSAATHDKKASPGTVELTFRFTLTKG